MTAILEESLLPQGPLPSVPENARLTLPDVRIHVAPGIPSHAASLEMNRIQVGRQMKAVAACALIGAACMALFFTLINKYLEE